MKTFPFVGVAIVRFVHLCLQSQDGSVGIATSLVTEKSIRVRKGQYTFFFFLAAEPDFWPTHACI
jgi:hypothetical protein